MPIQVEQLLCVVMDIRNAVVKCAYTAQSRYDEALETLATALSKQYRAVSGYLGDKDWLADFGMCAADFHFYEMLRQVSGTARWMHTPDCQ